MARYWWANQNQTYNAEVDGGYLWSPKKNQSGAYNQFYENVTLAQPGDIVFSFAGKQIKAMGVVVRPHDQKINPKNLGLLAKTGQMMDGLFQ